ncbi:MAG: hypothetical protein EAZ51_01610 [Sphingobacteriales bacterium]|nr:MAG: hypothetical protein EAZ51_01610 [Sphingobacteriales bacterium]
MFQNFKGYQKQSQLLISKTKELTYLLEIRNEKDPNDSKQYQLTDVELIELRDLLTSLINTNETSDKSNLDIQDAEIVE